jgi:putative ABC transport system permease protein
VVRVYLSTALIYGGLASLLAVPLAAIAAHLMAGPLLDLINVTAGPFQVRPATVAMQVTVGLAVPLLAALVPAVGGARVSPHRAISSYGLGGGFGRGPLDRLAGSIRRLPRPLALSLRNTFRRKGRVALTLLALALGGVMFMMVMSVRSSLSNTIEMLVQDLDHDVWVWFRRRHPTARLAGVAEGVPGVTRAEVWSRWWVTLPLASGEERDICLWGVPPDSAMFNPRVVNGRGLLPDDGRAVLLNSKIAADEGIGVGDEVALNVGGRESAWTVVGLVFNIRNNRRENFVPFDALARATGGVDRGRIVMVQGQRHDAEGQRTLSRHLGDAYTARNIEVTFVGGVSEVREQPRAQFDVVIYLMLAMAILAAVVGGIGLMGTTSINVVERGREIGVLRAIGATPAAVAGVFVGEGVLVGVVSWLLAVPLSYPGARMFSESVGTELFQFPLDFRYSWDGVTLWLATVVALSVLASLGPALRATRISVREALAYE